jgi:hypothetical protein
MTPVIDALSVGAGKGFLQHRPADLSVRDRRYEGVVRVCDTEGSGLRLLSDVVTQRVICFSRP